MEPRRTLWTLAGLTLLAALLRFATLDLQSFWFDEAVTIVDVLKPELGDTFRAVAENEPTPPLYFALAWAWTELFGTGEVGIRSLSALAGTLTVPVAYAAAARLHSRRAGLYAAGLVALSPLLIYYSQEARAYAVLVLLCGVSFVYFLRALDQGGRRDHAGFAVFSAAALLTHYFAALVVVPQALWLLARAGPGRRAPALLSGAAVAAVGLSLLPLARYQGGRGGINWIAATPLDERLEELTRAFLGGPLQPTWLPMAGSLAFVAVVGLRMLPLAPLVMAGLRGAPPLPPVAAGAESGPPPRPAGLALGLGVAAIALALAVAVAGADYFLYRYLVVAWLPLAVGGAILAASSRNRVRGLVPVFAICATFAAVYAATVTRDDLQRDDWRSLIGRMGPPNPGRVLAIEPSFAGEPPRVYGHPISTLPPSGTRATEIALLGSEASWADAPPPAPPGFTLVGRHTVARMTLLRYRSPSPRVVTAQTVASATGANPLGVVLDWPVPPSP